MKRQRATVIVEHDEGILLALDKAGLGLLPGGGVEPGELAIIAAARELYEETGLEALSLDFLFLYESPTNLHHVFFARTVGDALAGDDADTLAHVNPGHPGDEFDLSPATRAIIERFHRQRSSRA